MILVLVSLQRIYSLVIISVFLASTHGGESRFRILSSQFGGIPNATSNGGNSVGKIHLRVARSSDDSGIQISSEDSMSNRSITNDGKMHNNRKSANVSSTRKYVVVFDIDGCLCQRGPFHYDERKLKDLMENFPECPVILWNHTSKTNYVRKEIYIFLPFLQILFDYLLGQGIRIVFFSDGLKERNNEMIPELLKFFWGSERYEKLRSEGQFEIFSIDDILLTRDPTHNVIGGYRYVKDLNKTIRVGESLSDIILVSDNHFYTTRDQRLFIIVKFLNSLGESLNNIYYLIGIFKTYFENNEYKNLPLREGIHKLLPDEHIFKNESRWLLFQEKHPFTIQMFDIGLSEIQKLIPNAKLYVEADERSFLFGR